MESPKNKPVKETSKDLLSLENKSPYPDSFIIKKKKNANENNGPQKTFPVPKSSALEAAKAFLPKIAKANEIITDMNPEELNIENADSDEEHVEMNLAVYEYESDSSEESSSEKEEMDDRAYDHGEIDENNIHLQKPNKNNQKPVIEIMDSS